MPRRERRAKTLGIDVGELTDNRGKHTHHAKASAHPRWSENIISSHGYRKVRVGIEHPLADPNGYAYEHLLVWVSAGYQQPDEHQALHHRSGDKSDNRLLNLMLTSKGEHSRIHNKTRRRAKNGTFLS